MTHDQSMKQRLLVPSLIILGTCLLVLGLVCDRLVPSTAYWNAEQEQEYTAAQLDMHSKSHAQGADAEQQMAAARERFAKIRGEFESARGSQRFGGTAFLIVGVLLLAAGVVLHFKMKRPE